MTGAFCKELQLAQSKNEWNSFLKKKLNHAEMIKKMINPGLEIQK
jgi:hypothetical protein